MLLEGLTDVNTKNFPLCGAPQSVQGVICKVPFGSWNLHLNLGIQSKLFVILHKVHIWFFLYIF
jgi:hypothetical protein